MESHHVLIAVDLFSLLFLRAMLVVETQSHLQTVHSSWINVLILRYSLIIRVINFKFPQSLARNITSHRMKNFAFHSLLRGKIITLY